MTKTTLWLALPLTLLSLNAFAECGGSLTDSGNTCQSEINQTNQAVNQLIKNVTNQDNTYRQQLINLFKQNQMSAGGSLQTQPSNYSQPTSQPPAGQPAMSTTPSNTSQPSNTTTPSSGDFTGFGDDNGSSGSNDFDINF